MGPGCCRVAFVYLLHGQSLQLNVTLVFFHSYARDVGPDLSKQGFLGPGAWVQSFAYFWVVCQNVVDEHDRKLLPNLI